MLFFVTLWATAVVKLWTMFVDLDEVSGSGCEGSLVFEMNLEKSAQPCGIDDDGAG